MREPAGSANPEAWKTKIPVSGTATHLTAASFIAGEMNFNGYNCWYSQLDRWKFCYLLKVFTTAYII